MSDLSKITGINIDVSKTLGSAFGKLAEDVAKSAGASYLASQGVTEDLDGAFELLLTKIVAAINADTSITAVAKTDLITVAGLLYTTAKADIKNYSFN